MHISGHDLMNGQPCLMTSLLALKNGKWKQCTVQNQVLCGEQFFLTGIWSVFRELTVYLFSPTAPGILLSNHDRLVQYNQQELTLEDSNMNQAHLRKKSFTHSGFCKDNIGQAVVVMFEKTGHNTIYGACKKIP